MKKFCILLVVYLFISLISAFASDIPTNVKIKKYSGNGNYGIVDLDTGKLITPYKYDKLERVGDDFVKRKVFKYGSWDVATNDNRLLLEDCNSVAVKKIDESKPLTLKNSIIYGHNKENSKSLQIMVPEPIEQNLSEKIVNKNNEIFSLKFSKYPKSDLIIIKNKSKYGVITLEGNVLRIIPPQFDKIYFPDMNSAIFRRLGVSYSQNKYFIAQKNKKWNFYQKTGEQVYRDFDYITALESDLFETFEFNNNSINFTYKKIKNPLTDKYIVLDKKSKKAEIVDSNFVVLARIPDNYLISENFQSIEERILDNNSKSFIKFNNFPIKGSIITVNKQGKKGLLLPDNNKIPEMYTDFCFADSNSLIYRLLGITYDDIERIIAKKKDKWGIIDRNNKTIVDFVYDTVDIMPANISYNIDEHINTKDKNYEKRLKESYIDINFEKIEYPDKEMIFVSKNNNAGVIDKNGNVIIPFQQIKSAKDLYKDLSISGKNLRKWEKEMDKMSKIENIKDNLTYTKARAYDFVMAPFLSIWMIFLVIMTAE